MDAIRSLEEGPAELAADEALTVRTIGQGTQIFLVRVERENLAPAVALPEANRSVLTAGGISSKTRTPWSAICARKDNVYECKAALVAQ